jgi:hypothetical protein
MLRSKFTISVLYTPLYNVDNSVGLRSVNLFHDTFARKTETTAQETRFPQGFLD